MDLNKAGGYSALYGGLAYIVGFIVLLVVLSPDGGEAWSKTEQLRFLIENKLLLHVWNSVIYIIFGVVLIVLNLALHARIGETYTIGLEVAKILGLIWAGLLIASGMIANVGMEKVAALFIGDVAQAVSLWQTLGVIQDGLGGGIEVIGGLWVLLLSITALRSRAFPKMLNFWGILIGIAGCLTIVPGLAQLGAIFGLGQIIWFFWVSVEFLKQDTQSLSK